MNCQSFRENILELILPGGENELRDEMAAHAKRCPACAQYLAEMQATVETLQPSTEVNATPYFKQRVMERIEKMESQYNEPRRHWMIKLAIAASVLIAFGLVMLLGNGGKGGAAWAMEKTIEAYKHVRFIHIKSEPAGFGHVSDTWARFDEKGNLLQMRSDFPDTEDGPKIVMWQAEKAEVWFKKKHAVRVVREPDILKRMKMTINNFDPRLLVETLHEKRIDGKITMRIDDRKTTDNLIRLIVVSKESPEYESIYGLDPSTQLVTQIEKYKKVDGRSVFQGRIRYLDYNKTELASVFKLDAPAEVRRIDETTQVIGLAQGSLSDKEIAVKVVREFFEALIAKDYAKAGQIFSGSSAEEMKKNFGQVTWLRIVSIGEPIPHPENASLKVPCKIEFEFNGKKEICEPYGPFVRQVYSDRTRWHIHGGI